MVCIATRKVYNNLMITDNLQIQPSVLRFLVSEKTCNDLALTKYFAGATSPDEIAEGQRLCQVCPALADCQNYVQMMSDQGEPLQGVVAGTHWTATERTEKAIQTNRRLDRTRRCQGCQGTFQAPRTNPKQRYCTRSCRYTKGA